jgi:hypothetical protein
MLFIVLIMSAVFLGITAIAGLIMNFQLRQSINITDAAQAFFAADAAVDRGEFSVRRCRGGADGEPILPPSWTAGQIATFCNEIAEESNPYPFGNDATYTLQISPNGPATTFNEVLLIKGLGKAGRTARAAFKNFLSFPTP